MKLIFIYAIVLACFISQFQAGNSYEPVSGFTLDGILFFPPLLPQDILIFVIYLINFIYLNLYFILYFILLLELLSLYLKNYPNFKGYTK